MATILEEVLRVRALLDGPLPQSPSFKDILDELEAEYQHITNETNNTGNAWQVSEYTLTTVAGQYEYQISTASDDFFKALNVTTVPSSTSTDPQYLLEFTELENIPREWAWLGQNKGQYMFSSHDAQLIAFYRKFKTSSGDSIWCQIRPTPASAQDYKILYQVTDWWPQAETIGTGWVLPHSSQRFYVAALVAQNLLLKGAVRWSFDNTKDFAKGNIVAEGLKTRIERYKKAYEDYIASLDRADITYIDSWADENVFQ